MADTLYFEERQYFRKLWYWQALMLLTAALTAIIFYGLFRQVLGQPFGENPAPTPVLAALALLTGTAVAFLYALQLRTLVKMEGIIVFFLPLMPKARIIRWDMIEKAEIRTYRPLREYGGWGLRWGFSGTAYCVSGTTGLQLLLKNGSRVLIGTQQPDALMKALRAAQQDHSGARS